MPAMPADFRVYPRVCGGTGNQRAGSYGVSGLSPRVRGNPLVYWTPARTTRSIPACAGEPPGRQNHRPLHGVYPRVCGGTRLSTWTLPDRVGLSPRVRGNLRRPDRPGRQLRSIPACAGEPQEIPVRGGAGTVYPRVCGGTANKGRYARDSEGLSPRVRGNRLPEAREGRHARSIPACAGEPAYSPTGLCPERVYPRVCGGTLGWQLPDWISRGLSPRVRGNRCCRPRHQA